MRRILAVSLLAVLLGVGFDTLVYGQAHYNPCHVFGVSGGIPVTCMTGRGTFYSLTVNTKGASGNYTYIFDLATYSATSVNGIPIIRLDTTAGVQTLVYNILVQNGVVVWNTGGTNADLTISTE